MQIPPQPPAKSSGKFPAPPKGVGEEGGQCGFFINNWNAKLGVPRLYGNSLASKVEHIDSKFPVAGGDVIMDIGNEYGHVGKVIKVDPAKGEMIVMDSNWKPGTEKVQQRVVPLNNKNIVGYNNSVARM